MNLLLDTHSFIWCGICPNKLSTRATSLILDRSNPKGCDCFPSLAMTVNIFVQFKIREISVIRLIRDSELFVRDSIRSLFWIVSGRTGASFNPRFHSPFYAFRQLHT
ncbi:hypothetical protein NIES806_40640 [Dolichospermum compactum NIES-806]|uniref:Uncharacterized protein n=1 Tax=Dolichospermum compactum NIES-806 TaxID=1973481 RepID=A0A1Z4V8G6_9CYAN|nr:hypothetical protein NIES806_40640 [Dolichospermum compactum NIES-806]